MEKTIHRLCQIFNVRFTNEALDATKAHIQTLLDSGKNVNAIFSIYLMKLIATKKSMDKGGINDFQYEDVGTNFIEKQIDTTEIPLPEEVINFWGKNKTREDIEFLEREYANFKNTHEADTYAKIVLLKEVCETMVWNRRSAPKPGHQPGEIIAKAYNDSKVIQYKLGEARCLLNMGMGAFILNHDQALSEKYITESIHFFQELRDKKWEANAFLTQAIINNSSGNPESALYLGLRGMEFYHTQEKDRDYTMVCYVVGTIYKDLKKFDEAERFFRMGAATFEEYNSWNARIYTGLSNILRDRGEYEEAIKMGQKGLELLRYEDNKIGISRALNDLGDIYKRLRQYDKALE